MSGGNPSPWPEQAVNSRRMIFALDDMNLVLLAGIARGGSYSCIRVLFVDG